LISVAGSSTNAHKQLSWFSRAPLAAISCGYIDISDYAREHCDPLVRGRLYAPYENQQVYHYGFAKDVLEHIAYEDIDFALGYLASICPRWLLIVPLGVDGKYVIEDYEAETTHIIRKGVDWWTKHVSGVLNIATVALWVPGLKDKSWPVNPLGNLVLITQ